MRLFCLPAVLFVVAVVMPGCKRTTDPNAVRIACVGDSITWGSIIKDREQNCYPGQLARNLGRGFLVGNFGASGSFVLRGTPKPFLDHPFFEKSLAFRPNIVVLSVGTNDALPSVWSSGKGYFYNALVDLVQEYQGLPEHPRIILALPPPMFSQRERAQNLELHLRPVIKKVADDMHLELLDLARPLRGKSKLFWDGIHPTADACGIMARTVAEKIEARHIVASLN